MAKHIYTILSYKVVALTLLFALVASNSFVIAQHLCAHQMEESQTESNEQSEGCCCHHNKNLNTDNNAELKNTDCGCCITQGRPIDNSLPPVTISSNNLIHDHFIQQDINTQSFYSAEVKISTSTIPLITQDINILNANLRI